MAIRPLALGVLVACAQGHADDRPPAPPPVPRAAVAAVAAAADRGCVADGAPYDPEVLRARLAYLASPALDGRAPGSDGDRAARAYVAERFRCLGLSPAGDAGTFEQAFDAPRALATANVVGMIAGTDPVVGSEVIVIGAHHDHLGHRHLGANDNASGVTALLAIAQAIRQRPAGPRRTLVFVAFGAEEAGELGSAYFVAHSPVALAHVVEDINLDMVGSYASAGFVAAMGTFPRFPARQLLEHLDDTYPKLHVGYGGRAERSDHEAFCQRGIPYVFFWTPDGRCYHEACDVSARVDLPHLVQIAGLAGDLVGALADSDLDLAGARERLGCTGHTAARR
jgi:hypothetical protein